MIIFDILWKFFQNHIDPEFSSFAKKDHTQLQWKFEAVEVTEANKAYYPNGVKVSYKYYASNEVVKIVKKP